MEQNYATVALCIWLKTKRKLKNPLSATWQKRIGLHENCKQGTKWSVRPRVRAVEVSYNIMFSVLFQSFFLFHCRRTYMLLTKISVQLLEWLTVFSLNIRVIDYCGPALCHTWVCAAGPPTYCLQVLVLRWADWARLSSSACYLKRIVLAKLHRHST